VSQPKVRKTDGADALGPRTAQAYREVKRRIVDLELAPGAVFTEGEVAAELGLSKTPVREALARLQVESFVEVVGRSGYRVAPVTVKLATDLFALRSLLEPEAAALAAGRAHDRADLARLRRLARSGTNAEFHLAVARAGANAKLADVLENVLDHLSRLDAIARALGSEGADRGHADLVHAIAQGDTAAARAAAHAHVEASHQRILAALLASTSVATTEVTTP